MPYINRQYRRVIESAVNVLIRTIKLFSEPQDGLINYAITLLLEEFFSKGGYVDYERAIGLLECVKQEFYRRVVVPYEDKKRDENGDVY